MIAFALFLATLPQAAEPIVDEGDVVVVGRQASYGIVRRDARGNYSCALNRSSGDRRLDSRYCRAATDCVRKGARKIEAVHTCIDQRKPTLLAEMKRAFADRVR